MCVAVVDGAGEGIACGSSDAFWGGRNRIGTLGRSGFAQRSYFDVVRHDVDDAGTDSGASAEFNRRRDGAFSWRYMREGF